MYNAHNMIKHGVQSLFYMAGSAKLLQRLHHTDSKATESLGKEEWALERD